MCKKEISKEVIEEWKRFIASDEFQHNPECGTLLIAQHFAEWQKRQMMKDAVEARYHGNVMFEGQTFVLWDYKELPIKAGDKVKIIIVKKDK